jgi:carboxyl-terminal processing protease
VYYGFGNAYRLALQLMWPLVIFKKENEMKKKICLFSALLFLLANVWLWNIDTWSEGIEKAAEITEAVRGNYYKQVNSKELIYESIKGILPTLDPHSYFLGPERLSNLKEDYKGKYYGLGIMIQKHGDRLMVISPLEGTPAYRLGIQPGDIISHIEGESTKPISSYEAMLKLRGEKGTQVNITIIREGLDDPLQFTIVREEIPLHSVPYDFMLNKETGYIYIRNFSTTTTQEFEQKMESLLQRGMKNLVLDFRDNSGGTFVQSLEISDEFLQEGATIVSIKGRKKQYNKLFIATRADQFEDVPVVVLINRGSASAPEIVSGALQDNDRALIVGETSFGKGLVQTIFPVSNEAALALTTARYYTPSGRSIQRDYTNLEDWILRREVSPDEREVTYTNQGRKVLGQGGISPDYEASLSFKRLTYMLLSRGTFFAYARQFTEKETELSKKYRLPSEEESADSDQPEISKDLVINSEYLQDFKRYLDSIEFSYDEKDFAEAESEIKREIKRELISSIWSIEDGNKAYRLEDPVVQKALELMDKAKKMIS